MAHPALRWAVKRGNPAALGVLGFGKLAEGELRNTRISPDRATMRGGVTTSFEVHHLKQRARDRLVDFHVHYIKSGGATHAKMFEMTIRKHFASTRVVKALVNGKTTPLGSIALTAA